jgi:hypothetical protein
MSTTQPTVIAMMSSDLKCVVNTMSLNKNKYKHFFQFTPKQKSSFENYKTQKPGFTTRLLP